MKHNAVFYAYGTWPCGRCGIDFISRTGFPTIALYTGHQMTCLSTGKIMTKKKTQALKKHFLTVCKTVVHILN